METDLHRVIRTQTLSDDQYAYNLSSPRRDELIAISLHGSVQYFVYQ